jgi:hypothetical protein
MQAMGIGSRDHWFAKAGCDSSCPPIRIQRPNVKMTDFDRVKTIDLLKQPRSDRASENVKRVRRDSENRFPSSRTQLPQIIEIFHLRHFSRGDI